MKIRSNSVPTTPKSNYLELLVEHDLILFFIDFIQLPFGLMYL